MAEPNFFDQFDRAQPQGVQLRPADPKRPGELTIQGQTIQKNTQDIAKGGVDLKEQGLRVKKLETELANPQTQASEGERKAAAFVQRAIGGFRDYDRVGLGPRSHVGQVVHDVAPGLLNALPDEVGNSPERVAADRAQKEFVSAILRYDSGATIPPDEIESQSGIYFPKAGQISKEELEGYRQARIRGIESLISSAGRSITPEIQALIDDWRAGIEAQPQERVTTTDGRVVLDPGAGEQVAISGDGSHTENDPRLAGANAEVNRLLKSGASNREIVAYLKGRGADNASLVSIMSQLQKVREFQKKAPGFKGDFQIDIERRDAPNSAWNNIAASAPAATAIAAGDTFSGGHLDNIVGMTGGDADLANLGIGLTREQNPIASTIGDVAAGAGLYLGGAGIARGAGLAPNIGKVKALSPRALAGDAALGGYVASGQGGTQIVDPANVLMGGLTGAGVGATTRGALNTAGAAISPTGGALAPVYAAGVRPTVGQRLGAADNFVGRSLNRAEQTFASVPLVGGVQRSARNASIDDMQRGAFNEALGELGLQLPKNVKKGTQAHAFMQRSFDQAYDRARSGMQFAPDGQWSADLGALQGEVALLSKDSQNTFRNFANVLGGKLRTSGGMLSGDQYKLVVSRIDKKVKALRSNPSGDTELADALESFKTAIDDAARRQSHPDAVALLDKADRGYAKAVVIENAGRARGGQAGEFNGNQLDAAVQRTDKSRRSRAYLRGEANMQEFASAAKRLGDEVPDSGTFERLATAGGLAGLAKFIDPVLLAPWATNTAANLPGVRQAVGAAMAPRPQAIRGVTDQTRGILELLARYGAGPTSVGVVTE